MKEYKEPIISIVILDFNRPKEAELLINSIKAHCQFEYELVYVSNGGEQDYVKFFYDKGVIDILVLCKKNGGTGLGTKQGFKAANGKYVIYLQVDQWIKQPISQELINRIIFDLNINPTCLYHDLAGDQGHGNFSERALFIDREKYLAIPDLKEGIGGPGPLADHLWSEEAVQNYMKRENLTFLTANLVGDNGKISIRDYPCGGQIAVETDTKKLFILNPIKERIDFPNLKLTDIEWQTVLSGNWINGTVPEQQVKDSFIAWQRPITINDFK